MYGVFLGLLIGVIMISIQKEKIKKKYQNKSKINTKSLERIKERKKDD